MRERHPKTNGYSNSVRLASLWLRHVAAEERGAARGKRSIEEQLRLLDSRPGTSTRERARLMERGA